MRKCNGAKIESETCFCMLNEINAPYVYLLLELQMKLNTK